MEVKFEVTPIELKRLMGNCSTDREIVIRLLKSLDQSEFYTAVEGLANEVMGHILNTVTVKLNERGFSIGSTVDYYISTVKGQQLQQPVFEALVKMVKDRLFGMNLIIKHPNSDDITDGDLWKFSEHQPAVFTHPSNYRFGDTFSQFR